ncbi:unnamed protein product [Cylicocyclus nassatus]|uniref:RNA helicase n=1 Tax=Cylicocyclus nassatus TaxID=53992 RepID=A0AA36GUB1_CYLNA|nr:unnamed protein product [Cylicocyclus nassatus]
MGHAETGGGKTAAFVLPKLHYIIMGLGGGSRDSKGGRFIALVVASTRGIAKQLFDSFRKHGHQTDVKCCVLTVKLQGSRISRTSTKGVMFLSELVEHGPHTKRTRQLVSNEVHAESCSLSRIEKRQTFSATFPPDVTDLERKVLENNYVKVFNGARGRANARVKQEFVQASGICGKNDKLFGMLEEQRDELAKDGTIMRTLIFVETKKQADFVALLLTEKNMKAASINSDRPQNERERVIKQSREGTVHVLGDGCVSTRV